MPGKWGVKFKDSGLEAMLDSIEHVMPIAQSEWDAVALLHDKHFPQQARTVEPLHHTKKLFGRLAPQKTPIAPATFVMQN
jgi:hypothetical protein